MITNLQGGNGKYGLESDKILLNSANLLIPMNGEHLGTGAGTNFKLIANNRTKILKLFILISMPLESEI